MGGCQGPCQLAWVGGWAALYFSTSLSLLLQRWRFAGKPGWEAAAMRRTPPSPWPLSSLVKSSEQGRCAKALGPAAAPVLLLSCGPRPLVMAQALVPGPPPAPPRPARPRSQVCARQRGGGGAAGGQRRGGAGTAGRRAAADRCASWARLARRFRASCAEWPWAGHSCSRLPRLHELSRGCRARAALPPPAPPCVPGSRWQRLPQGRSGGLPGTPLTGHSIFI